MGRSQNNSSSFLKSTWFKSFAEHQIAKIERDLKQGLAKARLAK